MQAIRRRSATAPSSTQSAVLRLRPARRIGLPYNHEPIRIAIGQRAQQHRLNHAEDGGVCTDAKRHDRDGRKRKAGLAAERAQGVPEVAHGCVERRERCWWRLAVPIRCSFFALARLQADRIAAAGLEPYLRYTGWDRTLQTLRLAGSLAHAWIHLKLHVCPLHPPQGPT
jgi:hypothetical protein